MPTRTEKINNLLNASQKKRLNRSNADLFDMIKNLYVNKIYNTEETNEIIKKIVANKINGGLDGRSNNYKNLIKSIIQEHKTYEENKNNINVIDARELRLTESNIFPNGYYDFWIHGNEIYDMMRKNPNNFIRHQVEFYNDNNDLEKSVIIDFNKKMNRKLINKKLANKIFEDGYGTWLVSEFLLDIPEFN